MNANDTAVTLIRELERSRFWGSLEIQFQAGVVGLLKKTETVKPEAMSQRNNRGAEYGKA
ncbi:MAG: hypothetical protein ABFD89_18985 [Bryobacteraceae bacterium]